MGADPLTSPRSARVTEVRHLHDRRHRAARGAFVVEGPQAVEAAGDHGVSDLFVTAGAAERYPDLVAGHRARGTRVTVASDEVLAAMSETRQSQGIIAVCPLVTTPLDTLMLGAVGDSAAPPFLVVLDRVNNPGNAGTVIRSADALGANGVIMTEGSVDPHNGKCVRSTAGSLFHVTISDGVTASDAIAACRAAGVVIVTAHAAGDVDLDAPAAIPLLRGPVAWVFGSEAHGIDAQWRDAAGVSVRIPMVGAAESLNVAAAAAICLYATARMRR